MPSARCLPGVKRALRGGALAGVFLLLSGCAGYQLGPAKPSYLKDVHRIAVSTFRNDTLVPKLEGLVTSSVVKQLEQDGTYEITGPDSADAILQGTVQRMSRNPARTVPGNNLLTAEFVLTAVVHFQLVERGTGKILEDGLVDGDTSFFVSGDLQQDEQQAIPLAVERVAVRLTSRLTEGL